MFYLDLPTADCLGNSEGSWAPIGRFPSKESAVEFIRKHFGPCDDDGCISLLSEGDDDVTEIELSEIADEILTASDAKAKEPDQ